jgi:protein-disulfide isomerase
MTANRLLIALILLVGLGIGLPSLISNRSDSNASTTIDVSGMPVEGSEQARVAVVEFSDYECPYCARFTSTVLPELRAQFIAPGKVRHFFANFPLPNHPNAKPMAAAAVCAGKQNTYWKMHDELFATRPENAEGILDLGRRAGLQMPSFERCLGEDPLSERLRLDQKIADVFQVSGTPTFVLATIDAQGKVVAEGILVGAQPFPAFEQLITRLLNR